MAKKNLSVILVVDLEATCWETKPPAGQYNDVIEIGYSLYSIKDRMVGRKTSILVKPTSSTVSPFCTQLTGWTQEQVDRGVSFYEACRSINTYNNLTFASWGDYDRNQLKRQCDREGVKYPMCQTHLNVKNLFALKYGLDKEVGVEQALHMIGKEFDGRPHRGDDDSYNIARLLLDVL